MTALVAVTVRKVLIYINLVLKVSLSRILNDRIVVSDGSRFVSVDLG